jgi:EAL domain-containing protein (putative c-di-GMP-specific phosphodiesterase class I)
MLSIAKHLQLRVVAEGVETREQADFLINSGCDCLQGYLFGRPIAVAQFLDNYP